MSLDVLMLTNNDWSNSGARYSQCLRMLGLNVKFLKGRKHLCNYPEQGEVHEAITRGCDRELATAVYAPELKPLAEEAKVLHFIASTFVDTGVDLSKKNVVVQHNGTVYRLHHESHNRFFNQYIDATIIQMPELLGLGAKNEVWISFPVDTEGLASCTVLCGKLRIGHFPSNPEVKGTETVLKVIKELETDGAARDRFEYVGVRNGLPGRFPWEVNLDRIRGCDILIEACNLTQKGRRYGEWGNTAVEAAALGKVVVTNSLSIKRYESEYGKCPFLIANSESELKDTLRELITASRVWLGAWVVKCHSMEATAEKLKERVYSKFFDF